MLKTLPGKRDSQLPHPILMPGANRTSAPHASPSKPQDTSNQLVVGSNVRLHCAQIIDCDTLVVEGEAQASLSCRMLKVAPGGKFSGKVSIEVAEIHGNFDGELEVSKQLTIHKHGKVNGKIRYTKLLIEEGGQLSGEIERLATTANEASPA